MGSVIKSLKKLYKKMGGTNTKGINTVDGMVDKIAEKYEAGGSGGGTNSNLLVVDEWVDFTPWGFDYSVYCPKITARQAKEAIDAGKQIVFRDTHSYTDNEIETVYTTVTYVTGYRVGLSSNGSFQFVIDVAPSSGGIRDRYIQIYDWDEYLHPDD